MDKPIWSSLFARRIAETLGYVPSDALEAANRIPFSAETERIVQDMTEGFRYLGPEKIHLAFDFAEFLRGQSRGEVGLASIVRPSWAAAKLAELRDLVLFLRSRYGEEQPADEKIYWTEEDRQDAQIAALRRLGEREP